MDKPFKTMDNPLNTRS